MTDEHDPRDRDQVGWSATVLHGEAVLDRAKQVARQVVGRVWSILGDVPLDRAAMKDDTPEHTPLV